MSARLQAKADAHLEAAEVLAAAGDHRRALRELTSAERITSRLLESAPHDRRHPAALGALKLRQALLWGELGDWRRAILATRSSVYFFHQLDLIGAPEPDHVKARLADARAHLAGLLGAHGAEDANRRRELRTYFQDPDTPLYSEISTLDGLACHAYRDLVGRSGYTEKDFDRVSKQGDQAFRDYLARHPDKRW
jgi:hypothetical protein